MLDLGDLQGFDCDVELPRSGFLNLFYDDDEQPWGYDPAHVGGWRTILASATSAKDRPEPPGATRFSRVDLVPQQVLTVPGWEEPVLTTIPPLEPCIFDDRGQALNDALEAVMEIAGPVHQIGGWPWLQQGPFWRDIQLASNGIYVGDLSGYDDPRAATLLQGVDDWVLLAQIDTDDDAGWMWGDVGCLYYAIRKRDLATGDFDRTWMTLQCG